MFDQVTMTLNVDPYIRSALQEDITSEDVSTNSVMPEAKLGEVDLICKQDGIICGLQIFSRVFEMLDPKTKIELFAKDGDAVKAGDHMAKVTGDIRVLLCGERTALNYLQRMSGIATYTHQITGMLEGTGIKLLKDNHIGAAGGVKEAIARAKEYAPFVRKIEVEVEDLSMVKEAVEAGADIIMLDNMDHDTMAQAMAIIDGKAEVEVSGNMTEENLAKLSGLGVDYVSSGALTHSAPIMDISLKNLHPIEA